MAGQDPAVLSISASLLAAQRATGWCLRPAAQAACLRHGCATFLLAQGVPARAIREVLDHGEITVRMTLRYARMAITELYPHALGRSRARPRTQWTISSLSSGRRPEIGGVIVMPSQLLSDSDRDGSEDQPERHFAWSVVARSEGLEPQPSDP